MQILLTNDDGYFAQGLQTLYKALKETGKYKISIVAPESQRSAASHSITLFEPLFVTEYELGAEDKGLAIRGTPSDCVKLAIQGQVVPKPDLVISGINNGPNLGTDVFYSGTVGAAMEGVLLGVPAIAVSLASYKFQDFEPGARYLARFLDTILKRHDRGLLNINFPGLKAEEWKGLKVTRLGTAIYENVFECRKDPRGRVYYWQAGTLAQDTEEDTDLRAVQDGYVSLTPMHSDLTDYERMDIWKEKIK